jgi:tetratricopeptide (TPR) repeat protein
MIAHFNKLLAAFLLVGAALYIVLLNSAPATLTLTSSWTITAASGVIYLALFGFGVFCAALIGLFWGLKTYLRERKLKAKLQMVDAFSRGFLQARELNASGEWQRARAAWESLRKKDLGNIISAIELSRALEHCGDMEEGIRILEEVRAKNPTNIEVLFRSAELQRAQGNKTAALDNLNMILSQGPNKRALMLARDLAENLGRVNDALEYQRTLTELGGPREELDSARIRLEFRALISSPETPEFKQTVTHFCKRYPHFIPALQHLAQLELEGGNLEEAAHQLVKAAKASQSTALWNEVSRFWIQHQEPQKALAAARTATKETSGEARLIAELELIRIQIEMQQLEDAQKLLDGFEELAKKLGVSVAEEIRTRYLTLRGYNFALHNQATASLEVWKLLVLGQDQQDRPSLSPIPRVKKDAPAPQLSTP